LTSLILKYLKADTSFFDKDIFIEPLLHKKSYRVLYSLIVFAFLLWAYSTMGAYQAELRAHGEFASRIIIETNDGWQLPKEAIFITHAKDRYFISNLSNNSSTPELFVIQDTQVTKVIFLKNNEKEFLDFLKPLLNFSHAFN
jgi:hypothetical protein